MAQDAYTLKQKKNTDELHLFKGDMLDDGGCNSNYKSICQKMNRTESEKNIFQCKDENAARLECAKIGRQVCGICVSHLYTTY